MANFCISEYCVEGNIETLTMIANTINGVANDYSKTQSGKFNLSAIIVALGIYSHDDLEKELDYGQKEFTKEGFGVNGSWYRAAIEEYNGTKILRFVEEYKWGVSQNMELLAKRPPFMQSIKGVYRRSYLEGTYLFETTDLYGYYFPAKYFAVINCLTGALCRHRMKGYFLNVDSIRTEFSQYYPKTPKDASIEQMETIYHEWHKDTGSEKEEMFFCTQVRKNTCLSVHIIHSILNCIKDSLFGDMDSKVEKLPFFSAIYNGTDEEETTETAVTTLFKNNDDLL